MKTRHPTRAWLLCAVLATPTFALAQGDAAPATVKVLAAGSLRAALDDAAKAFEAVQPGVRVQQVYGASGLLKERLAAGEPGDVFASANTTHPQALADAGRAGAVQRFARNSMCLLVRPGLHVDAGNVVAVLMDPAVRLGTSTPRADPAGDYAFLVFDRIEIAGAPGAAQVLAGKAKTLTGGPNSAVSPDKRSVYGHLVADGTVDVFITYCTGAVVAAQEQPGLQVLHLPAAIDVSASYGITVLKGAGAAAQRYVDFVLSPAGQALLARHGFSAP